MKHIHSIYDSSWIYTNEAEKTARKELHSLWLEDHDYEDEYEEPSEEEVMDWLYEEDRLSFKTKILDLDKPLNGSILAFANIGLWNRTLSGVGVIGSNLNCILKRGCPVDDSNCYVDLYVNEEGDAIGEYSYHDGSSMVTFRYFEGDTDELSGLTEEEMLEKTKPLGKMIGDVYGW